MNTNIRKTSDVTYGVSPVAKKLFLPVLGLMAGMAQTQASTDYGPAVWYPCGCTKWYTGGNGHHFVVIHDMEGYYLGSRSYLATCSVGASVHYLVNGKKDTTSDHAAGEVSQSVREAYYAWHVGCWNTYMAGTEHEGFASNPAWYTDAMYNATIPLQLHMVNHFGIPKDRNHIIGHSEHNNSHWRSWVYSNYSFSPTCNTHSDPGPYWNWKRTMDGINGVASTPTAPSNLAVSVVSSSQLNLVWVDHSGIETGFKVERSTSSGSGFSQIGTTAANDVTYSSTGLSSGTTYYYRVRAYNGAGNSGYSNTAHATTKDVIPGAPTSLTATAVSSSEIDLTWVKGSGNPDGIKVERSTDNVTFVQIVQLGNVTTYNNTGLAGNVRYYYRVRAFNTAGNSAYSGTANDTTAPQTPTGLTAVSAGSGPTTWNVINLAWTDTSASEVGFKIERATASGGPFSQIATNAASDSTYSDGGRAALTTYWYRVRSYNANGNSAYSNTASATTPNAPPVLNAIGNKTVAQNTLLTFTATASDPNQTVTTTTWETFESYTNNTPNENVMFNRPSNSGSTSAFQDTSTNYTHVTTSFPTGHSSAKVMKVGWGFKTGQSNPWVRLNTFNPLFRMNPVIDGAQILRFDINSTKALKVAVGVRETGTAAAYGANGGTTGTIDWAGVTNVVSGCPQANHQIAANTWTTLSLNIPFEPQANFAGNGIVSEAKGTLEHLALGAVANASGAYTVYLDNFAVVAQNTLTYSLVSAPTGAAIDGKNGKFTWTPTSGQVGVATFTVKVTDQLGATDTEVIKVTVTGTGNAAPVLAAIGNKTVNELATLSFTATATDPNGGDTLTFSLDAGNPSGSSITTGGAFTWTPTEAQGTGGTYPITVRVTDNGSPVSNDFETITVTVKEINVAPVLAAIANQTVNEGSLLSLTASATDADLPANTLTYSLDAGAPAGMTIGSSSGAISWTPTESDGPNTYPVTVRVTDNGSPVLYNTKSFTVTVNEVNVAPVLTLGTTMTTVTPVEDFETVDDEAPNGYSMFRTASFSSTTSPFIDAGVGVYADIYTNYPDIDVNTSRQVLHEQWDFKTGTTNPWLRLTTYATPGFTNTYATPNPIIDFGQRLRFDVWTDKSIKLGIGVRETGSTGPIGFNGGTSGTLEWLGVPGKTGTSPNPSRVITASNWTTVEFNCPAEAITTFTGDGILATGKGVLEHLVIVPNGGMGTYNLYLDNFNVVTVSTNLTIDTLATIVVSNTATDADLPANVLTYSFGTGAPTNAVIDPDTGVFTWTATAEQSPSTNNIQIIVTDDGVPPLSDTKTLVVKVNKVNTSPRVGGLPDETIETGSGQTVAFTATGEDDDLPGDTLTFSLTGSVPTGATINASTGDFSWTPPNGNSTNSFYVRVTDNGVPPLWDEQPINIIVLPTNATPVLTLGTSKWDEDVVDFETFTNNTPNESVMFRKPSNSATTSAYIDTTATNYTTVVTSYPAGHTGGAKVLKAGFTFKTGANPYWVRLNTAIAAGNNLPNPTINFSSHLKFDIYTDKALLVGVGCRETGTAAAIGADGGNTGAIEYVGCTNEIGTTPMPNRYVAASTWTTLDFNLPAEPCQTLTGNSILAAGKGVLEHLILVGQGGTGAYTVHLDNFHVVTDTALPGTVTMTTGSPLTFTASATDPDPGAGLTYTVDADANTNAVMDSVSGAFSWTPSTSETGTSTFTVDVQDSPTNGAIPKDASATFSVVVSTDPLGPK